MYLYLTVAQLHSSDNDFLTESSPQLKVIIASFARLSLLSIAVHIVFG